MGYARGLADGEIEQQAKVVDEAVKKRRNRPKLMNMLGTYGNGGGVGGYHRYLPSS